MFGGIYWVLDTPIQFIGQPVDARCDDYDSALGSSHNGQRFARLIPSHSQLASHIIVRTPRLRTVLLTGNRSHQDP